MVGYNRLSMSRSSLQPQGRHVVIGVTGHIGAGKTSAAKHLSSAHGFQYLRYSQVLAEWMVHNPEQRAHLQEVGWEVMAGGLQKELNVRLIAQVKPDSNVVVDGLRHPIDYESLHQKFGTRFHLVYIEAPEELRWKRLERRSRFSSRAEFEAADLHPVEQQIDTLKPKAFAIVENKGSLERLYAAMDRVVEQIRDGGSA